MAPARFMAKPGRSSRAFALIECVVVLGVLLILFSLLLPTVARVKKRSEILKKVVTVQQNSLVLAMYAADHREYFPRARRYANSSAIHWYEPLAAAGYLPSVEASDPVGFSRFGTSTIAMSMCMVYDPQYMRPGFTVPIAEGRSRWVGLFQVAYPAHKGVMIELFRERLTRNPVAFCCGGFPITVPAAFADGSVSEGTRLSFNQNQEPVWIDGIGMPVFSSWGGYLAIDR